MADAHPQLEVGLLEVGPEPTTEPDLLKYFLNEDVLDGDFSKVPRSSPQDSPQDIFDSPETSPLHPLSSSSDMFLDPMFQTQLNGGLSYYDQATLFDNVILSVKDGNSLDLDDADMTGSKKRKIPNGITNLKTPLSPVARSLQSLGGSPPTDEERIQKRQKRLIKNRESAQLSRLRKKLYIEDLEKKVCTLTSENEALSKKIQTLSDELMYLRSTLKNSGANSALSASGAGGMLKKPALFNNKNGSAAGICLLIVLFSFGLVFNAQVREGGPMFPSSKRDPVPDVVPPSQRVLSSIKEEKTDGSASLRDLIDIFPSPQTHVKVGPSSAPLEKELDPAGKRMQPEPTFDRAMVKSDLVETGLPLKRIKTEPVDSDRGLVPIRITPSAASMTSKELSEQLSTEVRYPPDPGNALSIVQRHNSTSLQPRGPPTSYIYCSEAQEIVVTQGNANEPPTIALLLPAGVLNSTVIPHVDQDSDNTMVEVSCQVLNIHVWQVTTAPEPTRV